MKDRMRPGSLQTRLACAIMVAVVIGLAAGIVGTLLVSSAFSSRPFEGVVVVLAASIGIGLVLSLFFARKAASVLAGRLAENLGRIQEGVRRVRAGHLNERVRVDSGDELEELSGAFNMMTEDLKENVDRLGKANRELHALEQVKVDLVANVSHELRTPLTALKGFIELLDDGELGALGPEARRAVSVCRRNVDRLTLRVEDLVALSQMEKSWSDQPEAEPFDMVRLITMVAEIYERRIRAKEIRLSVEMPTELPLIAGNEEQIERAVINLVDNAVKFTPVGGTVKLAAEECDHDDREGVLIRVVDSGIGIPENELVRVFDRFHQVDPSVRRRFGGMGLGLSLVNHIVENHRGVVWAESDDGRGAAFFLWLPRRTPESETVSDDGAVIEGFRQRA